MNSKPTLVDTMRRIKVKIFLRKKVASAATMRPPPKMTAGIAETAEMNAFITQSAPKVPDQAIYNTTEHVANAMKAPNVRNLSNDMIYWTVKVETVLRPCAER